MTKITRIKGTQDILPEQAKHWQYVESVIHRTMLFFNYEELRTPVFEKTQLFARGIGEATDIVSKEMYTFLDRAKKSLTLKPEMTAPIVRAYLENNLSSLKPLTKIYYIAPLFRQENPQAGRLRQFNQFGAEALGASSAVMDAEIILLAMQIYRDLGISDLNLKINSVGDLESRQNFKLALTEYIAPRLNEYCSDCQSRFKTNPLRVLDCKVPSCKTLNQNAPRILDYLNPASAGHFSDLKHLLQENQTNFTVDSNLVRGLDYYTHTVFEITSNHLGSQDAICGGGRYDLLAEQFGGPHTPAVGFASGIERLLMVMQAQKLLPNTTGGLDIFIAPLGEMARNMTLRWLMQFRRRGYRVDGDFLGRSVKSQLREANRQNTKFVLVLGETELSEKKFSVKDMASGKQQEVSFERIYDYLSDQLSKNTSK